MKREILCKPCGAKARAMFPNGDDLGDGEHVKFVSGTLTARGCVCDWCDAPMAVGVPAVAFSNYSEDRPHWPWEGEYLTEDAG